LSSALQPFRVTRIQSCWLLTKRRTLLPDADQGRSDRLPLSCHSGSQSGARLHRSFASARLKMRLTAAPRGGRAPCVQPPGGGRFGRSLCAHINSECERNTLKIAKSKVESLMNIHGSPPVGDPRATRLSRISCYCRVGKRAIFSRVIASGDGNPARILRTTQNKLHSQISQVLRPCVSACCPCG